MHIDSQEPCARSALWVLGVGRDNVRMPHINRPKHYLRQWREHAGLKLTDVREAAAEIFADRIVAEGEEVDLGKIGLGHSTLSRIENFKVPYNERLLEVLAEVYRTDVPSLIIRNPADPEGIWSIYDQIPEPQKPTALKVLSGFRTGTNG